MALRFVNPRMHVFKTDRSFELLLLSSTASPYKLCFGPKSFLVISDPVQVRHILRDANTNYDKGVLAEILKPIMVGRVPDILSLQGTASYANLKSVCFFSKGTGLIPAGPEIWTQRRRQIVPAFHKAWLKHMVGLFGKCNEPLIENLNKIAERDGKIDMESYFCSVALDIIGLSVFNYDFGSTTKESPVIKAVYSALVEAGAFVCTSAY